MDMILRAASDKRAIIRDAAQSHIALALANYAGRTLTLDVVELARRTGKLGPGRWSRLPKDLEGRLCTYLLSAANEPPSIDGWTIARDDSTSRLRIICRRTGATHSASAPAAG